MAHLRKKERNYNTAIFNLLIIGGWLLTMLFSASPLAAQNADVFPVPETYKTEGIPAIKNSEVENLFYDPASIRSNLIWDTNKKYRKMLVTDETNNIFLLDAPLSPPVKLIEKIVPNSVKVRPDGNSFAYTDDHEDEDNYQLYLYDFREKTPKKVVVLTGKDESVDSFIWSKTGDRLFYVRADYDTKKTKLCQNDLQTEQCFQTSFSGIWEIMDTAENKILLKYWKASSSQHLYLFDTQTDQLMPLDVKGNSRKAFLTDERVFWTSEGSENCRKEPCMLSQSLKTGKVSQVNLPENLLNLNEVKVSPEGSRLLILDSKEGIDVMRVFHLKKDKITKEMPSFVSGSFVIWNVRWLSDREVSYTLENIGKPASIQSFNFDTKKVTDWTKERLPAQLADKVKSPEVIRWKSFDRKEITGYVVRPKTEAVKKSPVLIYVHGGPQILDKPLFNTTDIRFAANLGMATIHTNIRGSSGFGNDFMDADNKEKRDDAVKDIQTLLDWIGKQADLDSNQIYLRGISYGGFVVLSTALQEPSRIKGVIAEYPLVSVRGYLAQSWIDEFAKNEYGDPKDEDLMKRLDGITPLNNTDRWNNIPLFITRGKLDSRTSEKDVIDLKTQLQNKNSEVWFVYATDGGHGFGGKYVTAAMYQFLKKQIKKEY